MIQPTSSDRHAISKLPANSVICLLAPTASGKTALAYELYDTGRFELVSVDSALIYKDMNIGTAKPSAAELKRYPHHMVDVVAPHETFSVAQFVEQVDELVGQIHRRGKLPLLVGGTMMYFNVMFSGLSPVPACQPKVRAEVEAWRQRAGLDALFNHLKRVDPTLWQTLKANDVQRITRGIEVYRQTGRALSDWQALPKAAIADQPNQQWLGLAVMPDRAWLHGRIAKRLEQMWNMGLLNEVYQLKQRYPVSPDTPAMRCVGYRQVLEFFEQTQGVNTDTQAYAAAYTQMQNKALYATRGLAKRQYTWLRNLLKTHGINFVPADDNKLSKAPFTTNAASKINTNKPNASAFGKLMLKFDTMQAAGAYLHARL